MTPEEKQARLREIPAVTELLKAEAVAGWLTTHPPALVRDCLRQATGAVREAMQADADGGGDPRRLAAEQILASAAALLKERVEPRLRRAINATGVILHTGLGRAVFPAAVMESVAADLKGYATLAIDRDTGRRAERDELIEYILRELTGAEAATVVNNNAAATLLVLAAVAASKEVIVSRGQLIEIGGSFRLPEVMVQSGAKLVEVGATNRTHLRDYQNAITENTAAILRVHPSNYRIIGFTSEVLPDALATLAHRRGLVFIDDLGAGALVDLKTYGMPHEPTVSESLMAGADLVLFSGDKLIGASQAGVIVGRKELIDLLRRHPLMRALRADKTCLMVLERTLQMFRDPQRLEREHPTYRMLAAPLDQLQARAGRLSAAIAASAPKATVSVGDGVAYLGSGALPTEAIPSVVVTVAVEGLSLEELARRLRLDEACVFGRIEQDALRLDMRTLSDAEVPLIAAALQRAASGAP